MLKVIYGPEISFNKAERKLWYDHDKRKYDGDGWGIFFNLKGGTIIRHGLRPKYWLRKLRGEQFPHEWKEFDPKYHFLIRFECPVPIIPFLSICWHEWGIYLGGKCATINRRPDNPKQFDKMFSPTEINEQAEVVVLSVTTRSTRWK